MRVLGIDPGSLRTGYGVIDLVGRELHAVAFGVVAPPAGALLAQRLVHIAAALGELAREHQPDLCAIENIFTARSPRSALVLGQARGAAIVGLGQWHAPVVEVSPAQVKSLVAGHGQAGKAQVARAVRGLLHLEERLAADASDALAIAVAASLKLPPPGASAPRLRIRRLSARDAWTEEVKRLVRVQGRKP